MNRTIWNGRPIFTTEAQRAQRADVGAGGSADLPGASDAGTQTPLCDLCGSVVKSPRRSVRAAFTLIEVMIVIAIILAISGLVGVALFQQRDRAKDNLVRVDLRTLKSSLDQFRLVYDRYPTDEEGLAVLWNEDTLDPDAPEGSWQAFLDAPMPEDKYGHEWVYVAEGETREGYYDLYSIGRDGEEGTEDDVSVWEGMEDEESGFGFEAPTGRSGG